jgi:N-acetylmuramoyl-L-alanine amidase
MDDMTGTNWSEVPTTIVEMGFLSNKSDDRLMATEYFRQEAAVGIADGLDAYFVRLAEIEAEESRELAESIAEASREEASRNEEPEEELSDSGNGLETAPPMFSPAPVVTETSEGDTDFVGEADQTT